MLGASENTDEQCPQNGAGAPRPGWPFWFFILLYLQTKQACGGAYIGLCRPILSMVHTLLIGHYHTPAHPIVNPRLVTRQRLTCWGQPSSMSPHPIVLRSSSSWTWPRIHLLHSCDFVCSRYLRIHRIFLRLVRMISRTKRALIGIIRFFSRFFSDRFTHPSSLGTPEARNSHGLFLAEHESPSIAYCLLCSVNPQKVPAEASDMSTLCRPHSIFRSNPFLGARWI